MINMAQEKIEREGGGGRGASKVRGGEGGGRTGGRAGGGGGDDWLMRTPIHHLNEEAGCRHM